MSSLKQSELHKGLTKLFFAYISEYLIEFSLQNELRLEEMNGVQALAEVQSFFERCSIDPALKKSIVNEDGKDF